MCERVWRNAQECARKQRFMAWSRRWLAAASRQTQHTCQACRKVNSHASWSTTGQLAIRLSRDWNSRLSQAARSSRFWKNLTFRIPLHSSINTPFTHTWKGVSKENFERETLKKNKIDSPTIYTLESLQIPQLSSSPLSNPWEALITKPGSHHYHLCETDVWSSGKHLGRSQYSLVDATV